MTWGTVSWRQETNLKVTCKHWVWNPLDFCWQNDWSRFEGICMSKKAKMHWSPTFFPQNSISETTRILTCTRVNIFLLSTYVWHPCWSLLYIGLTCNLDSLWLATYFSGLKECQGIQDVVLMYCQWFSIQHAVILSPFPPIFYLRNHPHPPPAGVKITPGVIIPL